MKLENEHVWNEPHINPYLYKIGMFAAMNHITVKTLRFYEEQGLLIPAFINEENGYRYYTMSQMAVVHQITALKQAGFTLEDIARINAGSDEETVIIKKKSELLEKISELTKQVSILDGYLAKKKGTLSTPVLVKNIPMVTVACLSGILKSYDGLFDLMPELGEMMERAGLECAVPEYCFTNYLDNTFKEEDISVEVCQAVVAQKKEVGAMYFKSMPEVTVACIFHRGSYSNLAESYEIVLRYVEENGYEISGPIRENYIDGIWNKDSESEWLTEIQVPVRKGEHNGAYGTDQDQRMQTEQP